jgi:general L-amino acid transport system substrate-binding protein
MKAIKLLAVLTAFMLILTACTGDGTDVTEATLDDGATETTAPPDDGATETTAPPDDGAEAGESLLDVVAERGTLICGVNDVVPGFGFQDADGNFSGFDVDFCKAIAAAVLDDPEAVEYVPLTAQTRFTALQAGEVDILIRNTTFTSSRDGTEAGTFLTTTFYDGQGMMVRADSGFTSIEDMTDTNVCVLSGTTTELNLATRFGDIPYTPLTFEDNEQLQAAFIADQCDGWTSDKSQLAAVKSAFPDAEGGPDSLVILDETFSKEPLGPVVLDGDQRWAQATDWVVKVIILAEELEVDSATAANYDGDDADIRRLLGLPGGEDEAIFDPGLGLPTDFAQKVLVAVGNYAEIYDRNLGPDTAINIERGLNSQFDDGGVLYAHPYR